PIFSDLPLGVGDVTISGVGEFLTKESGLVITNIQVSWEPAPGTMYEGANLYVSRNGTPYQMVSTVRGGGKSFVFRGSDGDFLQIKVVAVGPSGETSNFNTAQEV